MRTNLLGEVAGSQDRYVGQSASVLGSIDTADGELS